MEQKLVREVLSITTQKLSQVDKEVGAKFNAVAMVALNQAEDWLIHGSETTRLGLIKQFITATSRLSAADAEEALSIHRAAFERELASMTRVTPHLTDVESEAITARAYDQDDKS